MLKVVCKHCKKSFPSPIQMDQASFVSAVMTGNTTNCPHCKKVTDCNKDNMKFE